MTDELRQAKQPVSAALAGPYGHPFHPMLVTVPIGAWTTSLVFDIASRVAGNSAFLARGSAWLIAIGVIGALIAGMTGFLDLVAIPAGTPAFRTGLLHMSLMLLVTFAYVGSFVWRQSGHGPSGPVPAGPLALSVLSLAVLGVGGFLGGKLVFRYGVRVAQETTQVEGYLRSDSRAAGYLRRPGPGRPGERGSASGRSRSARRRRA
jgi:uncharacterized membrane protein